MPAQREGGYSPRTPTFQTAHEVTYKGWQNLSHQETSTNNILKVTQRLLFCLFLAKHGFCLTCASGPWGCWRSGGSWTLVTLPLPWGRAPTGPGLQGGWKEAGDLGWQGGTLFFMLPPKRQKSCPLGTLATVPHHGAGDGVEVGSKGGQRPGALLCQHTLGMGPLCTNICSTLCFLLNSHLSGGRESWVVASHGREVKCFPDRNHRESQKPLCSPKRKFRSVQNLKKAKLNKCAGITVTVCFRAP